MNYWGRFGLEYNPFIKNTKSEVIIETASYKETMARLKYLQQIKGFGLLTGTPGSGKTTSLRTWMKELSPSSYKVIYVPQSSITTIEFYQNLAMEFGLEPHYRKNLNFRNIQNQIRYLTTEKKITPVIILDEADSLSTSTLSDLKILFNFDTDSKDRAIVILCGLPILNNILRRVANEPLRQRLVMNYNTELLNKEETEMYIREKLKKASGNEDTFTPSAITAIANASSGTVRVINKLCNGCLLAADRKKMDQVDEEIAMIVISDMEI